MTSTVLITGGRGLIGSALSHFLKKEGYRLIILTRNRTPPPAESGIAYASWDPARGEINTDALRHTDYIIHLAGASVGSGRWTAEKKKEIYDSRIQGTRLLLDSLSRVPHQVKAFIATSATGYYGHCPDKLLTEKDKAATDFLGRVCASWEMEIQKIESVVARVVILRTGIVLNNSAGLLPALVRLLRFGIAAIPGNGEQWLSWIHLNDLVRLYAMSLADSGLYGIYNAVSPFPVTLQQLINELARIIKGRFYIPVFVPPFIVKFSMGEKGMEILKSCKVSAEKLMQTGFEFSYPTIGGALERLYGRSQQYKGTE
jgi:uncharacterized protein (TIGR01777 family)